ncbi:MAG: ATP-binding protein [Candidatus Phytoplasma pyri]
MNVKKTVFLTLNIFIIITLLILVFILIIKLNFLHNERKNICNSVSSHNKKNLPINNNDNHNLTTIINNNLLTELMTPPDINFLSFDNYNQVYGLNTQKEFLKRISDMFNNSENYQLRKANNQDYFAIATEHKSNKLPKGVVFYGPPGTGKTYLAKCFAKESEMNFYTITTSDSLENIEQIFKKARRNSPSIIFCDEAEELMKSRNSEYLEPGDAKKTDLFLQELDGVKTDSDYPIYFIAATNYIDRIDSAILSRLEKLYFGYLKKEERLGYLQNSMKKYECDPAAYYYLNTIVDKINRALEEPEKFVDLIENHNYIIDAIGIQDSKGNLESSHDKLLKIERKKKFKSCDIDFNETLENIKTHFYDIQSNRKLDMLIDKAANLASGHKHSRILISDLNEALSENLGPVVFLNN